MTSSSTPQIGCGQCDRFGRHGYHLVTDMDRENPIPRIDVCDCVRSHCTCGALWSIGDVPGPAYGELSDRGEQATDETACICWSIRQRVARINRLLSTSNIDYKGITLTDVQTEARGRVIDGLDQAIKAAWQFAESAFREKPQTGLYLHGKTGGGKTYLASALLNEVIIRTGRPGLFINVTQQLFPRLRNSYESEGRTETETQVMSKLARVPYLVLDDLGVERKTDWEAEVLYNLIDTRYRRRQPVIITSNLAPAELEDLSRGRIASRIEHMCKIQRMPDEDLRPYFNYVVQ
jgi:DNA replication protein DnaC